MQVTKIGLTFRFSLEHLSVVLDHMAYVWPLMYRSNRLSPLFILLTLLRIPDCHPIAIQLPHSGCDFVSATGNSEILNWLKKSQFWFGAIPVSLCHRQITWVLDKLSFRMNKTYAINVCYRMQMYAVCVFYSFHSFACFVCIHNNNATTFSCAVVESPGVFCLCVCVCVPEI